MTAALVDAAEFERDRRLARAADAIAAGGDSNVIAIDCQCWTAIAAWLNTERFMGFHGGADPGAADAPWIGWPELEAAAASALGHVADKADALAAKPGRGDAELAALRRRRAALLCVHRAVATRRESIGIINAQIRADRERAAA